MSSKVKVVLDRAGVGELLKCDEIIDVLISEAQSIADNAGEGYDVYVGPNRANVSVATNTEDAYNDNLDNNTMEKAMRQ